MQASSRVSSLVVPSGQTHGVSEGFFEGFVEGKAVVGHFEGVDDSGEFDGLTVGVDALGLIVGRVAVGDLEWIAVLGSAEGETVGTLEVGRFVGVPVDVEIGVDGLLVGVSEVGVSEVGASEGEVLQNAVKVLVHP